MICANCGKDAPGEHVHVGCMDAYVAYLEGEDRMDGMPHHDDIQVASRWPEVNALRGAVHAWGRARYRLGIARRELEMVDRRGLRRRDAAYARYRDAVVVYEAAVSARLAAEAAAGTVAPGPAGRVWASVDVYAVRLARERAADRVRQAGV